MRIIIHIGTHKTGSTAIQKFCHQNRGLLLQNGVLWPSEEPPRFPYQHAWIAEQIRSGNTEIAREYLDRAYQEALDEEAHTLLLSSEDFSSISAEHLQKLKEILPDVDETRVIAYIRNAYDLSVSLLCEWSKHGVLLDRLRSWPNLVGSLDFDASLYRWEACFGEDDVEVFSYDSEKGHLLKSFLGHLGVALDDVATDVLLTNDNVSPDMITMLLFQSLGYFNDIKSYHPWRAKYAKNFAEVNLRWPLLVDLAGILVDRGKTDYRHPKLSRMRDVLLKKPEVTITADEQRMYLQSLRAMIDDVLGEDISPKTSE